MKKILTCRQMQETDHYMIHEIGVPSMVLMEKAALACMEELLLRRPDPSKVLVVCGAGNNGGDGLAIARLLHCRGIRAVFMMVGNMEKASEQCRDQYEICRRLQVGEDPAPDYGDYDVIVDAMFGVGLGRPVEGKYKEIIEKINKSDAFVMAVDIPSGINGDAGNIMGCAVRADLTVTMAYRKPGLCLYPGKEYAGTLVTADIGIYDLKDISAYRQIDETDIAGIPQRSPYGNKGTFGKVLVIAGSEKICGAAYLSGVCALRGGAGMVMIHTHENNRIPLQTLLPEALISTEEGEKECERLLSWCDVVVLGPGIGTDSRAEQLVGWFLTEGGAQKKPMILDADALNLVSVHPELKAGLSGCIITPHLMEFSRMTGVSVRELKQDPVKYAIDYSQQTECVVVCKDAVTVTACPEGTVYFNSTGNAGMATAGSGDCLTGILAAVLCRYKDTVYDPGMAAALGVYLHGRSGDLAREHYGESRMTAADLSEFIEL